MITEIAGVIGAVMLALVVSSFLVKTILKRGYILNTLVQIAASVVAAQVMLSMGAVSIIGAVAIVVIVILVKVCIFALALIMSNKVLNGERGEESMWVAEMMIEDGDEEFIRSVQQLSDIEKREIKIIAESKEELRELVIDRANRQN